MRKDFLLLGSFHIATSIIYILTAAGIIAVLYWTGTFSETEMGYLSVNTMVFVVIAASLVIIALPGILGGIGLIKNRQWSHLLSLIMGCLNLINFPLGTALGVYTIWVLMKNYPCQYEKNISISDQQILSLPPSVQNNRNT